MDLVEMYNGAVNSEETFITIEVSETDTTIYVQDGVILPDAPNLLVIGGNFSNAETVKLIEKDGNKLIVQRGFQSVARNWEMDTSIARNFTEADYSAIVKNIKNLNEQNQNIEDSQKDISTQLDNSVRKTGDTMFGTLENMHSFPFVLLGDSFKFLPCESEHIAYYAKRGDWGYRWRISDNGYPNGPNEKELMTLNEYGLYTLGQPTWHNGNLPVEFGGWTPMLSGDFSYGTRHGIYSRQGRAIHCEGYAEFIKNSTSGDQIRILGLPFMSSGFRSGMTVGFYGGFNTTFLGGQLDALTNYIILIGSGISLTDADVNNAGYLVFSIDYIY